MFDPTEFFVANLHTRDFEEIRELELGWDQRYDLIDGGGFEGRTSVLQCGERQLRRLLGQPRRLSRHNAAWECRPWTSSSAIITREMVGLRSQ